MDALTLSLVTLMIPGVIIAIIYDTYTQHKPWDTFRYILLSVVFGVIAYVVIQCAIFLFQLISGIADTRSINWYLLSVWNIASKGTIEVRPVEVLSGGVLAVPFGLLSVWLNKRRFFHEILLKKGISSKYGDDNVFTRSVEKMHERSGRCYVLIQEDNISVAGNIYLYNENEKTQEIGLLNATVTNTLTGEVLFLTDFIYLSKEYGKMMLIENYIEAQNE